MLDEKKNVKTCYSQHSRESILNVTLTQVDASSPSGWITNGWQGDSPGWTNWIDLTLGKTAQPLALVQHAAHTLPMQRLPLNCRCQLMVMAPETQYHQLYHLKSLVIWRSASDIRSDYMEQLTFSISNMLVEIMMSGELWLSCRRNANLNVANNSIHHCETWQLHGGVGLRH